LKQQVADAFLRVPQIAPGSVSVELDREHSLAGSHGLGHIIRHAGERIVLETGIFQ
jgi:hypothetical protein